MKTHGVFFFKLKRPPFYQGFLMKLRTLHLPSGRTVPALGVGTWYLGKDSGTYFEERDFLHAALDAGFRFFDTAELYGRGVVEEMLGEVLAPVRKDVFLSSKLSPQCTRYEEVVESCGKTLERLKTDYLDMYMPHWMGERSRPEEIIEAFIDLKSEGLIRDFGTGNFDGRDMAEWMEYDGAQDTAMSQGVFNLGNRRDEEGLLRFNRERGIPFVAFSGLEDDSPVLRNKILRRIASDRGATPRQVEQAWRLSHENVGVLIKAHDAVSLKEAYNVNRIFLSEDELSALSVAFGGNDAKTALKK